MEVTVKKVDGRLTAEIPAEALEALAAKEGETLSVDHGDRTELTVKRTDISEVQKIIEDNHGALKGLAQSERMDMVRDIMDQYDSALAELAK